MQIDITHHCKGIEHIRASLVSDRLPYGYLDVSWDVLRYIKIGQTFVENVCLKVSYNNHRFSVTGVQIILEI